MDPQPSAAREGAFQLLQGPSRFLAGQDLSTPHHPLWISPFRGGDVQTGHRAARGCAGPAAEAQTRLSWAGTCARGSRWGRAGAASSRETGSQDVQIAREQSSPFVARKIPSLPGSLSPSNLSSKSDLGDCRGLGCHLNAPFPSCPLPQGLLHLPPKPPRYDFPSLMGGPRAQTQV